MSGVRFMTREIGSLAKPPWRVRAFAGRVLEERDLGEAERWAEAARAGRPRAAA
jgi:5-methyltetrahydropteroyltriglutamate--homocysteine methyltransferase